MFCFKSICTSFLYVSTLVSTSFSPGVGRAAATTRGAKELYKLVGLALNELGRAVHIYTPCQIQRVLRVANLLCARCKPPAVGAA